METTAQPSEEQITAYLRDNPQFFEQRPDLLAMMHLPSLHGSGTVSLAERQQGAQRDKIRVLETKLSEFLQYGQENDTISDKVHRLSLGLLAAQQLEILLPILTETLREDFAVPYVALRVWASPRNANVKNSGDGVFHDVDSELKPWAEGLISPYCGTRPGLDVNSWFGESAAPKSFALIALRSDKVFGLLAIASDDERRFYPEMGTVYLKRIGELVSASLLRYID